MLEHVLPLISRHARHRLGRFDGAGNPFEDRGGVGLGDAERHFTENLSVTSRSALGCRASLQT
jgi:hypothetical protein